MLEAHYSNQARKFLKNADKIVAKRLMTEVEQLSVQPMPPGVKTVQGYPEKIFRVRVGDYRILYEVDYAQNKLGIVKIDRRESVYS